jgi:hypothetical protein
VYSAEYNREKQRKGLSTSRAPRVEVLSINGLFLFVQFSNNLSLSDENFKSKIVNFITVGDLFFKLECNILVSEYFRVSF